MRKSVYLLTSTPLPTPIHHNHTHVLITTPASHTHKFYPLSTIVIETSVQIMDEWSIDDNCGEWVASMGVVRYGCSNQEVGMVRMYRCS